MQNNIIKNGTIVADQWQLLDSDAVDVPAGAVIIPLHLWQAKQTELAGRKQLGIYLNSDQSPQCIADSLDHFEVIAINFPAFSDGRGFSYARELRQRYNYSGEIRAIGSFIRDQLFFLKRCGFDAFDLEGNDLQNALKSFGDFSDSYQAAIDQPEPLFRRR